MKKVIMASFLIFFSVFPLFGQSSSGPTLTMVGALVQAGQNGFQVDLSKEREGQADALRAEARSFFNPQVLVEGGHVNLDSDPFFQFGDTTFPAGEQIFWRYKVTATQILWDGGVRRAGLDAANAAVESTREGSRQGKLKAQREALSAWVQYQSLEAQRKVVVQRKTALEAQTKVVQDLYQNGVVARNDVLRVEVVLRELGDKLTAFDDHLKTALATLSVRLGMDPETPLKVQKTLQAPPLLEDKPEILLSKALTFNPALAALKAKAHTFRLQAKARRRAYRPTAVAKVWHQYEQNRYMLHPHVNGVFVGVVWNVFDGGTYRAQAAENAAKAREVEVEILEFKKNMTVRVESALRRLKQAQRELETARLDLEAATENRRILEDQYREGLVNEADVLEAEALQAKARLAQVDRFVTIFEDQGDLLVLTGQDLADFYSQPSPQNFIGEKDK